MEISCAICDETIENRFRSASRFDRETREVNIHPVHIDCIKDNANAFDVMKGNSRFFDFSTLDLLLMSEIINHLSDLEREGRLPELPDEVISPIEMPSPDTIGEPFYTLMEVIDGKLTGNIMNKFHDNEQLIYLYISEEVAIQSKLAANLNKQLENYIVAGISKSTLESMLNSHPKFMVVLGLEGTKGLAMALTGEEIREAIAPSEWLDKMIKNRPNS